MPIQNHFSLSQNKATMVYGEPPEPYSIQVLARAVLESPTVTAMESLISDILRLRQDDQQSVRSNQVLRHCTLNYPHDVVLKLSHLAGTCSDPQITAASISFLSTLLTKSGCQIMSEILTDLKGPLLSCFQNTAGPISRRLVPVLINVASKIFEASGKEWTEFLDYVVLSSLRKDQNLEVQEPALTVLSIFPAKLLHQLKRFDLGAVWSTILLIMPTCPLNPDLQALAFGACSNLLRVRADSMKDEALQEVLFSMISAIIETMNHGKRDVAESLVSFMGLMTTEVHSYAPKLFSDRRFDYVSEAMVAIVYKDGDVAGGVKREAVRVLVKLGELNREQMLGVVQKWGSDDVAVVVATLMEMLEDVIVPGSRVMSETFKLGYNSLNSMSSYRGEIMFDIVSDDMVKVNIEAEWRKRYEGVYAISGINEAVNKYLEQFVQILSKSLRDVSADVHWAASSTIRRFSTQFRQYHERILPALTTSLVDFDSDTLVDFDSDVLKGTTNFGFIYNGGVVLGADSRISDTTYNYIAQDEFIKVRRIRGNFQGTIYCTLAGSVKPWLKLYDHLNNKIIVTPIEDALDKAKVFLHQYMRKKRKKLEYMKNVLKTEEVFRMLIGGYTQTEGHRLGVVYLQHTKVYRSIRDSAETLGSGAEFADEILKISTRSMGCTTSKYSSELDGSMSRQYSSESEFKGTTIVALFYQGGVILGVDSRSSNEGQSEKPLKIMDDKDKMFPISSHIIAIMAGTVVDCIKLCEYVKRKCSRQFKKKGESVPYALQMAWTHLDDLCEKENKLFGILIAGWDTDNSFQIYCIYIKDSKITSRQVYSSSMFTSLGTGSKHANTILHQLYKSQLLDEDEVVDVALKALFNATFFDKFSGGPLNIYKVHDKEPCKKIRSLNALDVEKPVVRSPLDSKHYNLHEYEPRVLFLVYSTSFGRPIFASQLIDHFRDQGGKAIAAHLVVKKQDFYFHRVVCESKEDALRIYQYVRNYPYQLRRDTFLPPESFPYQVVLKTGVQVYVNKSTEALLQVIIRASN